MPELPEVEITRKGIAPYITDQTVQGVIVRNPNLRWRVPSRLQHKLTGQTIDSVTRRAKYLLLNTSEGSIIIHLGMSGSLRVLKTVSPPRKHDHIDIVFDNDICLRFHDPRRFGSVLWSRCPLRHRLLKNLGPEPLLAEFNGAYLYNSSRQRPGAVKNLLMNSNIVSGIGNIYATEALYAAGIHPQRAANRLSLKRYHVLADKTKQTLQNAIRAGGTTLRDFHSAEGRPGYFRYALKVYGKEGEPCPRCNRPIRRRIIQGRSSFYCTRCQH
ncbi:MAG: bifunctional DNA-formamidopyrimidine glycosylase/DNA-(apurinic or apyrimidinic site) lyase [Arenicellales bacterium]|nr:bifunctional DNA-formamidopyrimidine glycosylase/DNA-(apurinic or apyrimidinic site) lyase [Arenicellales bacterium]